MFALILTNAVASRDSRKVCGARGGQMVEEFFDCPCFYSSEILSTAQHIVLLCLPRLYILHTYRLVCCRKRFELIRFGLKETDFILRLLKFTAFTRTVHSHKATVHLVWE